MTKEETLSDKAFPLMKKANKIWKNYYKEEDVKEAVKKLKERLFGGIGRPSDNEMIAIIDKIFGDKLT